MIIIDVETYHKKYEKYLNESIPAIKGVCEIIDNIQRNTLIMISVLLVIGVLTLLYYLAIKPYSFWSSKHVKTGKIVPFFGDSFRMLLGKESIFDMVQRVYHNFPDGRYFGSYLFRQPVLFLRSPELIKQICVKDFDHFLNHRSLIPDGVDELWSKNLISLKGQTWKNMRSTLSPSFTSSKMKMMFLLICQNAKSFADYFLKNQDEIIKVEFKDAFGRYTTDVIASAAFGIQVDSLTDRENEFFVMGKTATNLDTVYGRTVFFLYQILPSVTAFFKIPLLKKNVRDFFHDLVKNTISMREKHNIKRPDMLGLLIEARKNPHVKVKDEEKINEVGFAVSEEHLEMKKIGQDLTDADITSQVFIFFLGGYETVSTAMCFMAYELAVNPDVQKRLIEEIDENRPENGDPSYETISKMTYLDMVVCEVLRVWPLAVAMDRVVTKPYTIQPVLEDEVPVHLSVGDVIIVPVLGIHHDPKYYRNPSKFDPERFSPENKDNINPYAYIPFGVGPRNCIGSRFALLEMKAVFFYLLSHFEIVPVEETQIPLKLNTKSLNLIPEKGFQLGLKRRH